MVGGGGGASRAAGTLLCIATAIGWSNFVFTRCLCCTHCLTCNLAAGSLCLSLLSSHTKVTAAFNFRDIENATIFSKVEVLLIYCIMRLYWHTTAALLASATWWCMAVSAQNVASLDDFDGVRFISYQQSQTDQQVYNAPLGFNLVDQEGGTSPKMESISVSTEHQYLRIDASMNISNINQSEPAYSITWGVGLDITPSANASLQLLRGSPGGISTTQKLPSSAPACCSACGLHSKCSSLHASYQSCDFFQYGLEFVFGRTSSAGVCLELDFQSLDRRVGRGGLYCSLRPASRR